VANDFEPTCEEIAGSLDEWPNCRTPDCGNKACLSLKSPLCFPCTASSALKHQVNRNHDYKPDSCLGCRLAAKVLSLQGLIGDHE